MKYELRALPFGETISTGFNIYLDNFVPLVIITLLCNIPVVIYSFFMTQSLLAAETSEELLTSSYASLLLIIVSLITGVFQSGLIIKLVSQRYIGKQIQFPELIRRMKSLFLPMIGVSFLYGLLMVVGLLLCLVPGIIIGIIFMLAVQVMVIEEKGIWQSMKRSEVLTKNRRGMLFLYILMMGGMSVIMSLAVSGITGGLVYITGSTWPGTLLGSLLSSLISPFYSCIMVLIYFNLRIEKEGFALEHLADQFSLADEVNHE